MKKIRKEEIEVPFIIGETYDTKFSTGERFTLTRIGKTQAYGIYERSPELGICPLGIERLVSRKQFTGVETEITVCPKCKHEFKD
jgi:hypothetical protein